MADGLTWGHHLAPWAAIWPGRGGLMRQAAGGGGMAEGVDSEEYLQWALQGQEHAHRQQQVHRGKEEVWEERRRRWCGAERTRDRG